MNRWLMRPRVMQAIAVAVFVCIALFQLPWSPAASAHFTALAGAAPFDSGDLEEDATFSHTFTAKGTYKYVCKYHEMMGMVGTVVVS